jgi:hypothetical protein
MELFRGIIVGHKQQGCALETTLPEFWEDFSIASKDAGDKKSLRSRNRRIDSILLDGV